MTFEKTAYLSSFGRNRGRSLRPYQQQLVDVLLPTLAFDMGEVAQQENPSPQRGEVRRGEVRRAAEYGTHSPSNAPTPTLPLQGREYSRIALEIGFGGGEHLLAQAAHNPDTLFIGCEPFINGVAKCLAGIDQQKLKNIRLFTNDARQLIEQLPDNCLDSIFILFPDPWPKLRHNKRRLINRELLKMLYRVHKPGGRLLITTDHVDYSVWILEVLQNNSHYCWTASQQSDWQNPPKDWTETKYQRKTTGEGREPVFLECVRRVL